MKIIAREKEKKKLDELFFSSQSELIAIYGRRRIGKTYLVRNYFADKQCIYFELIGQKLENGDTAPLSTQLAHFQYSFKKAFAEIFSLLTSRCMASNVTLFSMSCNLKS